MADSTTPNLAPPGAGLPAIEMVLARTFFAWRRTLGNRTSFTRDFQREQDQIAKLIAHLPPERAAQRVLIPRLRGLEDSSRYWSVWMTLEHLRIMHTGITGIMQALAQGKVPPGQASTAKVKPGTDITAAVVPAYEQSCQALLTAAAAITDLNTTARFGHPWFGPLNASGWYAMAGFHLAIHRAQIERILQAATPV